MVLHVLAVLAIWHNLRMPHLQSTRLFGADALLIRRVTCDGVDHPRPVEECSDGSRVIVVLRGRFTFRDRHVRAVASPCVSLYLRDRQTYQIRHVDGEGDVCLAIQGTLCDALVDAGPITRRLPDAAYLATQSVAARLADGDVTSRLHLEEMLCEALTADNECPPFALRLAPWGKAGNRKDREVAEAIGYTLARDFQARVSLDALAAVAGVSVFHACRAFKRATGTSIHRHHQELRLRHALAMLLETDLPLAQVAIEVGFANQPHFTNRFRQRFHATPRAVRRAGGLG